MRAPLRTLAGFGRRDRPAGGRVDGNEESVTARPAECDQNFAETARPADLGRSSARKRGLTGRPVLGTRPLPNECVQNECVPGRRSHAAGEPPSGSGRRRAAAFRLGYRPELDGLRGVAVLAVMAYHCGLCRFVPGGFLGVDLFFVLSGFLITALLLREHQQTGRIHLPRFYLRRALRLLPALFVMLAVCCLWAALRTKPDRAVVIYRAAALTACHAANAAPCWSMPMDLLGHAWSLSLEEQFYFVWPILLVVLLRLGANRRRIAWLVLIGIVASALVRVALWASPWPAGPATAATSLVARADSLLAGCLVGLLASAGRLPQSQGSRRRLRIAAGAATIFLFFAGNQGAKWGGLPVPGRLTPPSRRPRPS